MAVCRVVGAVVVVLWLLCLLLGTHAVDAQVTDIALYYESECPYCRDVSRSSTLLFITGPLQDAWKVQELRPFMKITLVPYGNAHETQLSNGTWTYSCQHGPSECAGNLMESCAIRLNEEQGSASYLSFIFCAEASSHPSSAGPSCAEKTGVAYGPIQSCIDGPLGNQYQHEFAVQTENLNPPHKYVPWVVVNGVFNETVQDEITDNVIKYVCKQIEPANRPAVCQRRLYSDSEVPAIHPDTLTHLQGRTDLSWVPHLNSRFRSMSRLQVKRYSLGRHSQAEMAALRDQSEAIPISVRPLEALPESFDARQEWPSCIHQIEDQGKCAAHWAMVSSSVLSDRFCVATKGRRNMVLSAESVLSCGARRQHQQSGCEGGRLLDGWKNLVESGAVTEKCLPFVSHDGVGRSCPTTTRCAAGEVERFFADRGTLVRPVDLTSIQTLLSRDGPLSATISVYEDFLMYSTGVYRHQAGALLGDLSVKIIGWGESADATPFWLVATPWTDSWAEGGFAKILRGSDHCGIESSVLVASPELPHSMKM